MENNRLGSHQSNPILGSQASYWSFFKKSVYFSDYWNVLEEVKYRFLISNINMVSNNRTHKSLPSCVEPSFCVTPNGMYI